jgi:hypothetical protein
MHHLKRRVIKQSQWPTEKIKTGTLLEVSGFKRCRRFALNDGIFGNLVLHEIT